MMFIKIVLVTCLPALLVIGALGNEEFALKVDRARTVPGRPTPDPRLLHGPKMGIFS